MKKYLILYSLILIILGCDSTQPRSMNQTNRTFEELKVLALDSGDIDAYNELETAFFEYAKEMADKHNYPQAYYDRYIQLLKHTDDPTTTLSLDSCDEKTRSLAIEYLQKASELGFKPATDELMEFNTVSHSIHKLSKLELFKNIVQENLTERMCDSLVLSNKSDFTNIKYLNSTFDINKIDSIEFYGRDLQNERKNRRIPIGTSLIIYSSNKDFYNISFDSLTTTNRTMMSNLEDMFKPGGIVFRTDNELILYSINACGPGYKNVQRIDSLIHKNVFESSEFYRLHNRCGMDRMKEIKK